MIEILNNALQFIDDIESVTILFNFIINNNEDLDIDLKKDSILISRSKVENSIYALIRNKDIIPTIYNNDKIICFDVESSYSNLCFNVLDFKNRDDMISKNKEYIESEEELEWLEKLNVDKLFKFRNNK